MRPFLRWIVKNDITLNVELVKSAEQKADSLSRPLKDRGDYTLDRNLFLWIQKQLQIWVQPKIDVFASPKNAQLKKFIARHPHWQAWGVDVLKCPLEKIHHCYANPPGP